MKCGFILNNKLHYSIRGISVLIEKKINLALITKLVDFD